MDLRHFQFLSNKHTWNGIVLLHSQERFECTHTFIYNRIMGLDIHTSPTTKCLLCNESDIVSNDFTCRPIWSAPMLCHGRFFLLLFSTTLQHLWLSNKPTGTDEIPFSGTGFHILFLPTHDFCRCCFVFVVLAVNVGCCYCTVDVPGCCTFIPFMFAVFDFHVFPCCCHSFVFVYGIRFRHLCTYHNVCIVLCAVCLFLFGRFVLDLFTHLRFVLQNMASGREREWENSVKGNIQCWPFCKARNESGKNE